LGKDMRTVADIERSIRLQNDWVEDQLDRQRNCCGICARPFKSAEDYRIDHDHTCETHSKGHGHAPCKCWRGLLCQACNTGLGFFKDSVRLLSGAIVYLEDHRDQFMP
jgi:hypothetical protein